MKLHKCDITVNLNFNRELPDASNIDAAELIQELLQEDFSENHPVILSYGQLVKLLRTERAVGNKI